MSIQSFIRKTDGNIAVVFAITMLPIMSFVGCALDYSAASNAYSKMTSCADAAILAAVSQSGMKINATDIVPAMQKWFDAQCPITSFTNVAIEPPKIAAVDTNGVRTASYNFSATRKNDFLAVAGFPTTAVKGTATGSSAKPTYIDIYAVLDTSPSMGLGATAAEQARLKTLTPDTCEFACHTGSATDNFAIARKNNVQLRIDVLRDAWVNMINKAAAASSATNNFRYATLTFDTILRTNQTLSASSSTALTAARAIDLPQTGTSGPGSSYIDYALWLLTPIVPTAGDGASQAASKKYVILVTDGVQDYQTWWAHWGHETYPITASQCDALKTKGVQVAVIYTTYLQMQNDAYNVLVKDFASQIAPNLQACATSGLYFEASQSSDISDAFDKIFNQLLAAARLTQ